MVECWVPYGETEVYVSIPIRELLGIIEPNLGHPPSDPKNLMNVSLENPLGSPPLNELVDSDGSISIAIEGTINNYLANLVLSSLLEQFTVLGVSKNKISIVIGNGTREERNFGLLDALGKNQFLKDINVIEHSCFSKNLLDVGTTSKGTQVNIEENFGRADTRIAVGEVIPDVFTGFRGAHTTILPALSGLNTLEENRRHYFEVDGAPGLVEGNPVFEDVMEATLLADVAIAVNLVTDPIGRLLAVYSGGVDESWRRAISEWGNSFKSEVESNPDVIIISSGGKKFDFDLYNGIWVLNHISQIVRKGTSIILLSECSKGLGAEGLAKLSNVDILSELKRRYMLGGEAVHSIKSFVKRNEVVLVSALPDYQIEPLGFSVARTANSAFEYLSKKRRRSRTLVFPYGSITIPSQAQKVNTET